MTALILLQFLIEKRQKALKEYVSKPNASDIFIKKENEFIAELISIYNQFDSSSNLKYQSYWLNIESEIGRLMNIDTEIGYAIIRLNLNEKHGGIYLNINPDATYANYKV